jgi:hypothetical protein
MEVTLSPADATDLPILAEMNRLVYMREAISMIAFKNWPAETNMFNFFQSRIKQLMETPNAYIFKATSETGEIVGFISCTLVHEKGGVEAGAKAPSPDSNGPTAKAMGQMEDIFNMEFMKGWAPVMESMKDLINGMKHYCEPSRPGVIYFSDQFSLVDFCGDTKISRQRHWIEALETLP